MLRRQARQVQRVEEAEPQWLGEQPIWMVAPSVPGVLHQMRSVHRVAKGCYQVEPSPFSFLWIAANDLPLCEELIPFLVARSGRARVEFARWVVPRRPASWVLRMLQILPMPLSIQEEFERYLAPIPRDDPEINERGRNLTRMMLKHYPEVREELIEEGLKPLCHLFERRLRRALSAEEHRTLSDRAVRLGPNRLGDVVLDLSPDALAAWLSDPSAT